jgi:hypothetical protein
MTVSDSQDLQDQILQLTQAIEARLADTLLTLETNTLYIVRLFLFLMTLSFTLLGLPVDAFAENAGTINGHDCQALPIPIYGEDYNREVGSYDYLPFALAAMNTYSNGGGKIGYVDFTLERYNAGWKKIDYISSDTGMYADYYFREGDSLDVLIAFRGTTGWKDWFSNLSWLTRIIPIDNEHDSARAAFEKVATEAIAKAGNRPVRFVATGHSLGGGLAQHVAYAFPCVSAAVFDTSCVTDEFKIGKVYSPDIVSIHQLGDELTGACRFIGYSNENGKFHRYAVDYINSDKFQHNIEGAVVGMARGVADCQREEKTGKRSCAIPQSDPRPKKLYCDTYGQYGPDDLICPELVDKK